MIWLAMLASGGANQDVSCGPVQIAQPCRAAADGNGAGSEVAAGTHSIPPKLNATPHRREVRQHFYGDAVAAMQAALGAGKSRIRLRCIIPELNVETDGGSACTGNTEVVSC